MVPDLAGESAGRDVTGVVGNHGRPVDHGIVPDLASQRAKFAAEFGIRHAGTTREMRFGVGSGRRPGGRGSPVSSMTSISSRAMSGASSTTFSGLAPRTIKPGKSGLVQG